MSRPISTTPTGRPIYAGRHRLAETQRIALRPVPPLPSPTVSMPALRLLPPVQPDRRTDWKLTRRGRIVRDMAAGAAILGGALLVEPTVRLWAEVTVAVGQIVGAL